MERHPECAGAAPSLAHHAARCRPALSAQQWADVVTEAGDVRGFEDVVAAIANGVSAGLPGMHFWVPLPAVAGAQSWPAGLLHRWGTAADRVLLPNPGPSTALQGLDPSIRAQVWPLLLGVFDCESTTAERLQQHADMACSYQELQATCKVCAARHSHTVSQLRWAAPGTDGWVMSANRLRACCLDPQALNDALHAYTNPPPLASGVDKAAADKQAAGALSAQEPGPPAAGHQPSQHVLQFAEAHRLIVIDAVRTDFRKHTLAAIGSSKAGAAGAVVLVQAGQVQARCLLAPGKRCLAGCMARARWSQRPLRTPTQCKPALPAPVCRHGQPAAAPSAARVGRQLAWGHGGRGSSRGHRGE